MKKLKTLLVAWLLLSLLFLLCGGCAAWAPNSWNATVYAAPYGKPVQSVAFGVSGPIPPHWWDPRTWFKAPAP